MLSPSEEDLERFKKPELKTNRVKVRELKDKGWLARDIAEHFECSVPYIYRIWRDPVVSK